MEIGQEEVKIVEINIIMIIITHVNTYILRRPLRINFAVKEGCGHKVHFFF